MESSTRDEKLERGIQMRDKMGRFTSKSTPWNKGINTEQYHQAVLFKNFRDFMRLNHCIVCRVCGAPLRRITHTHLKFHNLTVKKYREIYPNAPLMSEEEKQRISDRMIKLGDKNWCKKPEVRKKNSQSLKEWFSNKENHPLYGKHRTPETIKKISKSRTNVPSHRKGMTYEQEYGKRRANEIIQKIKDNMPDMSGKNSPLYGTRNYPKPYLVEELGHVVRSSWEERVLLGFKKRGIKTLGYEPRTFEFIENGRETTYTPDTILEDGTLVEVKGPVFYRTIERLRAFKEQYPDKKLWIITGDQGEERLTEECYDKLTRVEEFM